VRKYSVCPARFFTTFYASTVLPSDA
jgi:hypothetical protein